MLLVVGNDRAKPLEKPWYAPCSTPSRPTHGALEGRTHMKIKSNVKAGVGEAEQAGARPR